MQEPQPFQVATWKIVASIAISVTGAALVASGIPVADMSEPFNGSAILWGVFLTYAGILFGAVTIRCPVCRSRLLLREISLGFVPWYRYWFDLAALSRPATCPRCKDDLKTQIGRFQTWEFSERHPVTIVGRLVFGLADLFLSAGFLMVGALAVKLGLQEVSLMGAIVVATAVAMVAIAVLYLVRRRS